MSNSRIEEQTAPAATGDTRPAAVKPAATAPAPQRQPSPVLQQLARLYPELFGASPRPLKRGIFDDLAQAQPDLPVETLKQALSEHTRSTRYLQSLAAGLPRHDLQQQAVEPVAVEHAFHAIVEIFRRKQKRGNAPQAQKDQARQWLARRLRQNIEASGLTAQAYTESVSTKDATARAVLEEVSAAFTERAARDEALLHAFEASNTSVPVFAEMYGLTAQAADQVLARARHHRQQRETGPEA